MREKSWWRSAKGLEVNTHDYTPDAVCQTLGLGPFDEEWARGKPAHKIRLLLCPSFDPEICIDLERGEKSSNLRVAIPSAQIWRVGPGIQTVYSASQDLGCAMYDSIEASLRAAVSQPPRSGITLDGMPVHIAHRSLGAVVLVRTNPGSGEPMGGLVADVIATAFEAIDNQRIRNALSSAGRYVGRDLPYREPMPAPSTTHIAVIGTPGERAEMLAAVAAVAAKKASDS